MEEGLATRRGRARASNQATSDAGELIYGREKRCRVISPRSVQVTASGPGEGSNSEGDSTGGRRWRRNRWSHMWPDS